MIGATLQKVSRARSNKARILALFLGISVIHGQYFPQEVLLFGFALSIYILWAYSRRRFSHETGTQDTFGLTDTLLLGMLIFTLLGLIHPVKVKEGLIEALRWGIFWFFYRMGLQISSDETTKGHLFRYLNWLAIAVAIVGWLPWVSKTAGRLSSVFGYPNATAAFLGAVILLYPGRKLIRILLGVSLLATGSRAGVGLFFIVFISQQLLLWVRSHRGSPFLALRQRFQAKRRITFRYLREIGLIILGIIGTVLVLFYNRSAWENLTTWGFSTLSWQERLVYFKDGISMAWNAGGLPQAGGWLAFPTVQSFPYWTAEPHSSFIHILLNQGVLGIILVGFWGSFTLIKAWKTWDNNRVWWALLFLVLHSLVDADFSFGSLGLLFWMLFGSQGREIYTHRLISLKQNKLVLKLGSMGTLALSLILCLASGSALLNPELLERERHWNNLAIQEREQDPDKSGALWNISLKWDQTQNTTRRELAEFLLQRGNTEEGFKAVESVLNWQPLDLGAYEWAQSVVWDTAEMQRQSHPETANMLYRWVERVPQKIEGRVATLSSTDRWLWKGYQDFQPSQHIKLLAEYARQRQLTQLLPKT